MPCSINWERKCQNMLRVCKNLHPIKKIRESRCIRKMIKLKKIMEDADADLLMAKERMIIITSFLLFYFMSKI